MSAWRWIGSHVAALAGRGLVLAPAWALWSAVEWPGWTWVHALSTWLPVAYVQTRVPGGFPVSFRWWGPAVVGGFLLAYWAAESAFYVCFSAFGSWIEAKGLSPSGVSFIAACVSYGFVFPVPQASILLWKVRHASIWLWVAAVGGVQMVMAPLGVIESFALGAWKSAPLGSYGYLLLMGAVHGALLGLATLVPLRRLLSRPA